MSGICGIFNFAGRGAVGRAVLEKMLDALSHRGPGGGEAYVSPEGRAGIACNGIAPHGKEKRRGPFVSESDGAAAALDGLIFNAGEVRDSLREKGVPFSSDSDAEVVLRCYLAYGEGFPEKLEGEFALAVVDWARGLVLLARDNCGVKPLYYHSRDGLLLFASEIKSLLAHPAVTVGVNDEGVYHFLTFGACPAPFTLFRNMGKVSAGSVLRDSEGKPTQRRYWHPMDVPLDERRDRDGLLEVMDNLLLQSVKASMRTDGPLGIYLSGGLDSSVILALMRRQFSGDIHSFTLGFPGDGTGVGGLSEADAAASTAERFGTKHRVVLFKPSEFRRYHTEAVRRMEDPNCASQNALMYRLAIEAAEAGVPLVLTGEAGDALFLSSAILKIAGFGRTKAAKISRLPRWLPALLAKALALRMALRGGIAANDFYLEALRSLARGERFFWGSAFALGETFKRKLLSPEFARRCSGMNSHDVVEGLYREVLSRRPEVDALHLFAWVNFGVWISEQGLRSYEGQSAAHGVEARVPFLCRRLVEAVFSTPAEVLAGDGSGKAVLKAFSEKMLPGDVIYRKKIGFSSPMIQWWSENLPDWLEELMDRGGVEWTRFFRVDMLRRILRAHRSRRQDLTWQIMHLINFALWHMFWIEGVDE